MYSLHLAAGTDLSQLESEVNFIRPLSHISHVTVCHVVLSDVVFPHGVVNMESRGTGQYSPHAQ